MGEFPCHKTIRHDEDGEPQSGVASDEQHCAGSLIFHEKQGRPHQMMRITERLGLYDPTNLDMQSPVYGSVAEMESAMVKAMAMAASRA